MQQHFASDNYAGICPEALRALLAANVGHERAYGDDHWTGKAANLIRDLFETDCEVFFVFNGTAANSLALSSLCQSYHGVICHELAHAETDECGGPEFFSNGSKLLLGGGENGKLTPAVIDEIVTRRNDIHYPKPKVISITQATETGTVYSEAEIAAIAERASAYSLKLHMDGARFSNAVATLGLKPRQLSWEAGVDVLCFGGTKNGLPMSETVVFFKHELAVDFEYRCKQAGQLASKMRFVSAPWVGLLESGAWLGNAQHANRMAQLLCSLIDDIPSLRKLFPVQANSVFVEMPDSVIDALRAGGWRFYTFIGSGGVRLMCAWDTTEESVRALARDIRAAAAAAQPRRAGAAGIA